MLCLLAIGPCFTEEANAQDSPPPIPPPVNPDEAAFVDRLISRVDIVGLNRVPEQKVRNVLLTQVGDAYDPNVIADDLNSLYRLGDFRTIVPRPRLLEDGTVAVTFELGEQPLLVDVQVVGNKLISDQQLLGSIPVAANIPRDDYLIEESRTRIRTLYRDRGHYLAEVEVDETTLEETGVLIFRILEGPRVKVRSIEFEGNTAFSRGQLKKEIESETAAFILRKGRLDEKKLTEDVGRLERYYRDRGYRDVRVGRTIELSPNDKEAAITFIIDEGPIFTMREVTSDGSTIFSDEQLSALAEIKTGDIYSEDRIRESLQVLQGAYGELGYYDARVQTLPLRIGEEPRVDLRFQIDEGERAYVGNVVVQDNFITKDKVIRRQLPFSPGRPMSANDIEEAERRLRRLRLFADVDITVQEPDPLGPLYRDVLVEVVETNTGSVNFGVAAGSDAGLLGEISINQRNFDLADFSISPIDIFTGKAFRGAGQIFNLALQPGNEVSTYSISLTEPYLFDQPLSLTGSAFWRNRQYREYDEERKNVSMSLSRSLGDLWSIGLVGRYEEIELDDIDPSAASAIFAAEGPDTLTSLGLRLTRTTVGTRIRPGRGNVLEFGIDRYGALGGDYDFTSASLEYTQFLTLNENFLGQKSILRLNAKMRYIFESDEAPLYERFYLGGRSFRGFDFRTISPKGFANDTGDPIDDPVGGEFLLFLGAQYEFPLYGDVVNGVIFADSGTVTDDPGFDDYRVSVGVGLRLYVEAFGPVPIAFDFGFPIVSEDRDEEQLFSFSAEVPF